MSKNILITGSSGFIGTHFTRNSNEFNLLEIDLLQLEVDQVDFSNINSVLHLAAIVHQMRRCSENEYFKVNSDLAYQVAKRAKAQGVSQFILMSTSKVYGELTSRTAKYNEETPCFPEDPYGQSKLEAEKLVLSLEDINFKIAIIRSPIVYGEGVKANMLNLIKLIDFFPIIPLGGIKNNRSLVYVGNLVALIKRIIQKQASGIFIAGDQIPLSTSELITLIAKCHNKKRILIKLPNSIIRGIKFLKPSIVSRLFSSLELDNKNTNRMLNFVPPFSTQEGICKMIFWYKNCYHK